MFYKRELGWAREALILTNYVVALDLRSPQPSRAGFYLWRQPKLWSIWALASENISSPSLRSCIFIKKRVLQASLDLLVHFWFCSSYLLSFGRLSIWAGLSREGPKSLMLKMVDQGWAIDILLGCPGNANLLLQPQLKITSGCVLSIVNDQIHSLIG